MRLIDADALFDAMEEAEWYNNADRDEVAERLIIDAPTVYQWIPCSERMPDKDGRYLCTNSDIRAIWETSINVWSDGEWLFDYTAPIAWMPLPRSYEEGEE